MATLICPYCLGTIMQLIVSGPANRNHWVIIYCKQFVRHHVMPSMLHAWSFSSASGSECHRLSLSRTTSSSSAQFNLLPLGCRCSNTTIVPVSNGLVQLWYTAHLPATWDVWDVNVWHGMQHHAVVVRDLVYFWALYIYICIRFIAEKNTSHD